MRSLAVALVCLLWAGVARGDDRAAARAAYVDGKRYYDMGEYQKALDAFKTAYLNFEEPSILFNIAQCHRQLGNRDEALKVFRSFLRNQPDSPAAEEVRRIVAELEKQPEHSAPPPPAPSTVFVPAPVFVPVAPAKPAAPPAAKPIPTPPEVPVAQPSPPPRAPAVEAPASVNAAPATPEPKPETRPTYKKWWVWTIAVGSLAVVGVSVGVSVGLLYHRFDTTLGTVSYGVRE